MWTGGSMAISLTRILWSIIDTIDQKEKFFTDESILLMVSMTDSIDRWYHYRSIDPSPIMSSYAGGQRYFLKVAPQL
jgi:hypothetical protein